MDSFDPQTITIPHGHFIGGVPIGADQYPLDVLRPSDDRIYAGLPDGDADLVDRAVSDARHALRKHDGEVAATATDHLGLTITEPYGVIGAIAPWNFPLVMACWKLAPALAAGNAVVLKPSEMMPFGVTRLAALGIEAGLPRGIFNIVQGNGTRTGAAIMATCAHHGTKPVTLELGGKSSQIVFADAPDLASAA